MIRKNISKEHEENSQMKNQLPNNKATKSSNLIEVDNTQENQTVKENEKMQEENNVVEEVKNEDQIKDDSKKIVTSPFKNTEEKMVLAKQQGETSDDPTLGTGILGGVRRVKEKKPGTGRTRKEGNAEKFRKYIVENYPNSAEFVTTDLSDFFRTNHNLKNSDISGQLFGLRTAGWIENRKPTEAEMKIMGKGIKIWKGTDKLYEVYSKDLKVAEEEETFNVSVETNQAGGDKDEKNEDI
ncbi:hypothetical protein [Enterococcus gilvus]|uniref:hypothetical protein n=1 Tax=Enterococcus gilvus TaxID=160453 RepID=UPI00345E4EF8